jgi:AraC-like DNA-binding protein
MGGGYPRRQPPGMFAVPFKVNADRRHHIPKQQDRVTNWSEYDAALRQRGSLTVWFSEEAIAAWQAEPRTTRGCQPRYSTLAIATALTLRTVFRLALPQTEGLIGSVMDFASIGEAMAELDLASPQDPLLITPAPAAIARLQRLHAAAADLAENAPEIIANPDAARGLEQALVEAMIACLGGPDDHETSVAQRQHALVMRRFRRVVEENPEQPLYVPDICKAIRVSERTLRMCCQEHLGMAPKRYLLLRRMHLVRRALREAASDATSVTDIATRYGFWQLGRFAVEYQALFGESPSATLRRQHA